VKNGTQTDISMEDLNTFSDEELKDECVLSMNLTTKTILKDDKSSKFFAGMYL